MYDGFISYSHAADDLLAPRLQSALQRFAKPWWKRRAVRIFRDESSLSANPHLWSSITEALDTAGWFVLLLSPDAAASEWVNQEISYWVEHRDPKKILPVVTDGTFDWAHGDVSGDAVPDALRGVFSEEPRWVDVRWAREEDQLDLQDPRFADAVADIASTIRGVPKDDLASEEVRQHRRTVRTAWAAGAVTAALAVAAVGFGVSSARNANEAERQALRAEENAAEAQQSAAAEAAARDEAVRNAAQAQESAERADAEAQAARAAEALARSRELGTAAFETLEDDPELAALLALQAIDVAGSAEDQPAVVLNALRRAIQSDYLEWVLRPGEHEFSQLALSPDDSMLAAIDQGVVGMYRVPEGELLWTYEEPDSPDAFSLVVFSPDGTEVAVSIPDSVAWAAPGLPGIDEDERPARILFLEAMTGEINRSLEYPDCNDIQLTDWSADTNEVVVTTGWEVCDREETSGVWVEVLDAATLDSRALIDAPNPDETAPQARFSVGGELVLLGYLGSDARILSGEGYADEATLEGLEGWGDVSPDGRFIAAFANNRPDDQVIYDRETGARADILPIPVFPSPPDPVVFSADGRRIAIQTEGRDTLIYDVETGREAFRLPSGAGGNPAFSSDGTWLYTSHRDGTIKAWNLEPKTVGATAVETFGSEVHVQGSPNFSVGDNLGSAFLLAAGPDGWMPSSLFFDAGTGAQYSLVEGVWDAEVLADGRFAAWSSSGEFGRHGPLSPEIVVYDPLTGETVALAGCASADGEVCDDTGEPVPNLGFRVSLDGEEILIDDLETWWIVGPDGSTLEQGSVDLPAQELIAYSDEWFFGAETNQEFVAIDRETGDEIASFPIQQGSHGFSPDKSMVAFAEPEGIVVIQLGSWETTTIPAEIDRARGFGFSPSGRLLAIGDENKIVVLDIERGRPVQEIPIGGASAFHWFNEETFLLGTRVPARWLRVSLDVSGIVDAALAGLTRGFTETECFEYGIDPCPTLEEMRDR